MNLRERISRWIDANVPLVLILMVLLGMLAMLAMFAFNEVVSSRQSHRAYAAWIKLTGNTNNLTYQEWRDLKSQMPLR